MQISRLVILTAAAGLIASPILSKPAQAVTYNLVLQNTILGPESGTGSFTINGPIGPGLDIFTAGSGLADMSFTIDGSQFTLLNALPGADVAFLNGQLINVFYAGALAGAQLDLTTAGLSYTYSDLLDPTHISAGTIATTPLPATWTLMLAGLAGFGFLTYRRQARATLA